MTDIVDPRTRSRMMSGIKGSNTKPETLVRSRLHRLGFRFRIHDSRFPGKPDIVLPKYSSAIFVHGCFWHCHDCKYFKWPKTRRKFWKDKLQSNKSRDDRQISELHELGFRTMIIWECALKRLADHDERRLINEIADWIRNGNRHVEFSSVPSRDKHEA